MKERIERQFLSVDPPVLMAAVCVVGGRNPGIDIIGSDVITQTIFSDEALSRLHQRLFQTPPEYTQMKDKGLTICLRSKMSTVPDLNGSTVTNKQMRIFIGESVADYVLQKFNKRRGYWGKEEFKPPWWPEGTPFISPGLDGMTKPILRKICQAIYAAENTKEGEEVEVSTQQGKKKSPSETSDQET